MALETFLDMLDIWYFQLRDESIITPKYLMKCFSPYTFFINFYGYIVALDQKSLKSNFLENELLVFRYSSVTSLSF